MYAVKEQGTTLGPINRAAENSLQEKPTQSRELPVALSTLEDRLSVLEKEQSQLIERLGAILRSEPAQTNGPGCPAPEFSGCTAVTSTIAIVTNRVNGLIFRTRAMLDLLEL